MRWSEKNQEEADRKTYEELQLDRNTKGYGGGQDKRDMIGKGSNNASQIIFFDRPLSKTRCKLRVSNEDKNNTTTQAIKQRTKCNNDLCDKVEAMTMEIGIVLLSMEK